MAARILRHLLPLAAYAALTVGFTYPTVLHLATHVPGFGDTFYYLWHLWWVKHSLLDLHQLPLVTSLLFHPLGSAPLTWHFPVVEVLLAPLQDVTGLVPFYNLLVLSTFVLSGYFMYLLALEVVHRRDLAFVSGLIFAFCAYRGGRALLQVSLLTTQWLPLALLLLILFWRRPGIRRGVVAGIGVALVGLSYPYYIAYFLLPVAVAGGLYAIIWRRAELLRQELWRGGFVAVVVAGAISLPFVFSHMASYNAMHSAYQDVASQSTAQFSADLLGWLAPSAFNRLWGQLTATIYQTWASNTDRIIGTTVFFGFAPLVLAALSYVMRWPEPRQVRFWQMLAALAFVLSFGPALTVAGQTILPWMPYRLFMAVPLLETFRAPARLGLTAALAGTILAMLVLRGFMEQRPAWPWRAILALWCVALLVNLSFLFPYPSTSAAIPPAYQRIASEPGEFGVLDLPAGEHLYQQTAIAMYYQTYHHKPIVSGYLARTPARLQAWERETPFVRRFFNLATAERVLMPDNAALLSGEWPDDVRQAAAILRQDDIRFVVLRCHSLVDDYCRHASILLNRGLGLPVYRDGLTSLYEVPASGPTGEPEAALQYSASFSPPFLASSGATRSVKGTGAAVTLTVPVAGTWLVQGELEGPSPESAAISVDGWPVILHTLTFSPTLLAFEFAVDLQPGAHALAIRPSSPAGELGPCRTLCLRNLAAWLQAPAGQAAGKGGG